MADAAEKAKASGITLPVILSAITLVLSVGASIIGDIRTETANSIHLQGVLQVVNPETLQKYAAEVSVRDYRIAAAEEHLKALRAEVKAIQAQSCRAQ